MSCKHSDYNTENLYTWCTNCGNYGINGALKLALLEEGIEPKDAVLCFDIGCHGNGSDKIAGYNVHGLHGRVIPFASGVALANDKLTVVASGGDGATLGEGINHLIHSIRNDYNITFLLHDNENYGLTTGQASPTTKLDAEMNSTVGKVATPRINVADLVFSLEPTFYARAYSGNVKQLIRLMRAGFNHKGFSLIHIMQDCPTYNDMTPHEWYLQHVYEVSEIVNYNSADISSARKIARDMEDRIATGLIYRRERDSLNGKSLNRLDKISNLVDEVQSYNIDDLLEDFR